MTYKAQKDWNQTLNIIFPHFPFKMPWIDLQEPQSTLVFLSTTVADL